MTSWQNHRVETASEFGATWPSPRSVRKVYGSVIWVGKAAELFAKILVDKGKQ